MRGKSNRRPVFRSLIACGAVAASTLVFSLTPALADTCTGHSQPGLTITVGGNPVRIPAVAVQVCWDVSSGPLVPIPRVYTSGYPCETACVAVVLDYSPSGADQEVSVSVSLDGSTTSRSIVLPVGGGTDLCLVGVGVPSPPRSGCFVSVDPDGF